MEKCVSKERIFWTLRQAGRSRLEQQALHGCPDNPCRKRRAKERPLTGPPRLILTRDWSITASRQRPLRSCTCVLQEPGQLPSWPTRGAERGTAISALDSSYLWGPGLAWVAEFPAGHTGKGAGAQWDPGLQSLQDPGSNLSSPIPPRELACPSQRLSVFICKMGLMLLIPERFQTGRKSPPVWCMALSWVPGRNCTHSGPPSLPHPLPPKAHLGETDCPSFTSYLAQQPLP